MRTYSQFSKPNDIESLSRHLDRHTWGAIPLCPPGQGSDINPEGVDDNLAALAMMTAAGYVVAKVTGDGVPSRIGAASHGWRLVFDPNDGKDDQGALAKLLMKLACKLTLPAVLTACPGQAVQVHRCSVDTEVESDANVTLEDQQQIGLFVQQLRHQDIALEDSRPSTINGMRGMHLLAKVLHEAWRS